MNSQHSDAEADAVSQLQYEQAQAQAAAAAAQEQNQDPNFVGGSFSNVAQGLSGHYRNIMMTYWQNTINSIEHDDHEFKIHQLPLARIKKVMKADEDVKMISAEAPILFAKGCDIFITELTMRAWIHAEENKRRTLQRSDIASALQKSDMFDFLIDIVPREEAMASSSRKNQQSQYAQYDESEYQAQAQAAAGGASAGGVQEGVEYADEEAQYDQAAQQGEALQQHQQTDQQPGQPGQQPGQQVPQLFGDLDNIYNGYRQY